MFNDIEKRVSSITQKIHYISIILIILFNSDILQSSQFHYILILLVRWFV